MIVENTRNIRNCGRTRREKVRDFQNNLYLTAKKGSRRFHALYDKIYRPDILEEAWNRVKANKGAGGIDEISIQDILISGEEEYLEELRMELKDGRYRPSAVKRILIPKPDGRKRPLGLPTIRDKVVQMAVKIVIEPLFEADFKETSYGFRPRRSAVQALEAVRKACDRKGYYVIDADIQSYFDEINHDKLMNLIERRISDRKILNLLKQWLKVGVMEAGECRSSEKGSVQGGVISPLLANVYLNALDTWWEKNGAGSGQLVRYADDMVIICKSAGEANRCLELLRYVIWRLDLNLHPEKTRLIYMRRKEGFDFLGMHHARHQVSRGGRIYYRTMQYPCQKARKHMREEIKAVVRRRERISWKLEDLIRLLNPKLIGWRNYYGVKTAKRWLNGLDWYVIEQFTRWDSRKRQKKSHINNTVNIRRLLYSNGLQRLAA